MEGLAHSTPGTVVVLLLVAALMTREFLRVRKGYLHSIRRIPGIDAIDGAIGRSAEQGRPVFFTTALTSLGPVLYACLGVLHFVAKKAAQYKLKLIIPQNQPDVMAVVEDVTRNAYVEVGRGHAFVPEDIRFLSDEQFAFASGYQGLINRENAGSAFLFGSFAAEALVLSEAGQQVGARQVAASASPEQVAFFICTCDYTLIGEELFSSSAYITRDPVQVATIASLDRFKLVFLTLIVLGVVATTLNSLAIWDWRIPTPDILLSSDWSVLFGS
jgi:hypothetical protein